MSLIQKLTPINLLEEKLKFFADFNYNPQFIYSEEIPEKKLYQYGLPQKKYLALAQEIVDRAYHHRNEQDLLMTRGPLVSQKQVELKIKKFLKMHGLSDRYKLVFSSSFVSRTSITGNLIKLRLPTNFRKQGLLSMLYHEIGTHAIRRVNYEQQAWFGKKKKYNFQNYLKTEEGLAILHAHLVRDFKLVYAAALRYLIVAWCQKKSFAEVWSLLNRYVQRPAAKWGYVLRSKRGLTDSSYGGGFTKEVVYFEGVADTWQYLSKNNFDITNLYFGKLAYQDVDKAIAMNPSFQPLLPSFFVLDRDKYAQEIYNIGQENYLNKL